MDRTRLAATIAALFVVSNACTAELGSQSEDLEARSSMVFTVEDGWLDIEDNYLARVCTQENGNASYAALEAQVIAARTYLLRAMRDDSKLGTEAKPVVNGESFQAYSATANPGCKQAALATRGVVATWGGELIVANYVAGALVRPDGTLGKDLTHTEHFVTYNQGKTGDAVTPAPKPIALPSRSDNRGCMGQNRADYLSDQGYDTDTILRYFYGDDIELVGLSGSGSSCDIAAEGACHDGVLFFCDGDTTNSVDCAGNGRTCIEATAGEAAQCSAPINATDGCNGVTYEGSCNGDTLTWCNDQQQLITTECGDEGLTCGSPTGDASGGKACIPPVEGSCSEGTIEPQCVGTIYLRCRSKGDLAFIDCASLGKACGYFDDSVGCFDVAAP